LILKEKNLKNSLDPKLKAGESAEKQMAFYLSRAFANQEDCYVINDLRINYKNDTAQIDHLVVSQYGLFIIESKSVYGKIIVNAKKEWSRTFNKIVSGMASPVLQAEAQAKVIKNVLKDNKDQMLGTLLGLQKGFGSCPVFVYVAISDGGIIERKADIPELKKADQVAQEIELKIKTSKKNSSILGALSNSDPTWSMTKEETIKVADFLLNQNKPLIKPVVENKIKSTILTKTKVELDIHKENDLCPKCNLGKLVKRKAKTEFLGCSNYPKCKFTNYK
jgi:Nuclease-related domain/Topoisomerase DNA binding C4 zinc finger